MGGNKAASSPMPTTAGLSLAGVPAEGCHRMPTSSAGVFPSDRGRGTLMMAEVVLWLTDVPGLDQ